MLDGEPSALRVWHERMRTARLARHAWIFGSDPTLKHEVALISLWLQLDLSSARDPSAIATVGQLLPTGFAGAVVLARALQSAPDLGSVLATDLGADFIGHFLALCTAAPSATDGNVGRLALPTALERTFSQSWVAHSREPNVDSS